MYVILCFTVTIIIVNDVCVALEHFTAFVVDRFWGYVSRLELNYA